MTNLCCHSCAPYIEHRRRQVAGTIPAWIENEAWSRHMSKERESMSVPEALAKMGWKNPFRRGTAELK